MTVKELIAQLQTMPQDAQVATYQDLTGETALTMPCVYENANDFDNNNYEPVVFSKRSTESPHTTGESIWEMKGLDENDVIVFISSN